MSRSLSLYSIVIASGASVIGRMIAATVAQRTGAMIPWITCVVVSAVMCLSWIGIHSVGAFLAFAALYGKELLHLKYCSALLIQAVNSSYTISSLSPNVLLSGLKKPSNIYTKAANKTINQTGGFSGALIPLPPTIFPTVCPDPKVLGARLGMAQAIGAFASLIGSPIAGALVRGDGSAGHDYLGLQLFCGCMMLFGSFLLSCLWFYLVKKRKTKILI